MPPTGVASELLSAMLVRDELLSIPNGYGAHADIPSRVRTRVRDTALCEFNGVSAIAFRRLMALPDQGCATAARNAC
jgi:hypothetical protein